MANILNMSLDDSKMENTLKCHLMIAELQEF